VAGGFDCANVDASPAKNVAVVQVVIYVNVPRGTVTLRIDAVVREEFGLCPEFLGLVEVFALGGGHGDLGSAFNGEAVSLAAVAVKVCVKDPVDAFGFHAVEKGKCAAGAEVDGDGGVGGPYEVDVADVVNDEYARKQLANPSHLSSVVQLRCGHSGQHSPSDNCNRLASTG